LEGGQQLNYISRKNYVQKIRKQEIQVKKNMNKQATMRFVFEHAKLLRDFSGEI